MGPKCAEQLVWEEKLAFVEDDGEKGEFPLDRWYLVHASSPFKIAPSFYPQNQGGGISRTAQGIADLG